MREVNPYRRQLRQALINFGPGRACADRNRCPYVSMGVVADNCQATRFDPVLTLLIDTDEKEWEQWESFELLDLIDHLDGPVDFLVEP